MRLLSVQWFVLLQLFLLAVAAITYGSLSPWCIHLRHVPDFENFWKRWARRGFYGVRDLATFQLLFILTGLWAAAGACGIQTSHITGIRDHDDPIPNCRVPYLAVAIPTVLLTFAALPIDSEDPFFEVGWGVRVVVILLIYFIMPFFRQPAVKPKLKMS
eukprot:TRINITY_DN13438_c0_g1_i1.p1 TRINITY_DN13438_c0_g1~~TRINITY_DN13438_c0_g1_i1.p1  ORF type:complete len:187 (+),score=24.04 TRINITY_DN13438_c0_g1_i1:87-563(+)